jgi:hypothetical protein
MIERVSVMVNTSLVCNKLAVSLVFCDPRLTSYHHAQTQPPSFPSLEVNYIYIAPDQCLRFFARPALKSSGG